MKMEVVEEQYNHDLAQWERQIGRTGSPPEKESVREKLRQLQQQGKQKHAQKSPLTKSGNLDKKPPCTVQNHTRRITYDEF